jgi:hypothetical protein
MSAHPTIPYKRCLNNWRSAIVFNHINFKLVKRNCIEIIEITHCFHLLAQQFPYACLNYRAGFPYTYGAPFTYPFVQAAAAVV